MALKLTDYKERKIKRWQNYQQLKEKASAKRESVYLAQIVNAMIKEGLTIFEVSELEERLAAKGYTFENTLEKLSAIAEKVELIQV